MEGCLFNSGDSLSLPSFISHFIIFVKNSFAWIKQDGTQLPHLHPTCASPSSDENESFYYPLNFCRIGANFHFKDQYNRNNILTLRDGTSITCKNHMGLISCQTMLSLGG